MKLEETGREPDLLFVTSAHRDRIQEMYLDGPADLAIEIISKESVGRDRDEKFAEYEQAGVLEFWLIDPIRKQTEFYHLIDGHYRLMILNDGIYHSEVLPGFRLCELWLWEDPLPNVLNVLRKLEIIA